jgi:two-component system sensor histidine kinase HydH
MGVRRMLSQLKRLQMPEPPYNLRAHAIQWGSLAVALALGAALVGLAVQNYWDAVAATKPATLAQGMQILRRLRIQWNVSGEVLREKLPGVLESEGATYLGLWESGQLLASAGQTEYPGLAPTPLELQLDQKRARMSLPGVFRYPQSAPVVSVMETEDTLPVDRVVVWEFEPTAAHALVRRALVGLALSSGAALVLMSAAVVLWHFGRRTERMRAELDRKEHLARLGAMSAVLAHEIRNPLSALKGNAQLLAEDPHNPRAETRIQHVVKAAVRLEALTNDLLHFARSGAVHAAPTSPAEILEAAALTMATERILLSLAGAPPSWRLDAGRMEQVLINLLDNALKVTPDGKQVMAEVRRSGTDLVYAVRDHGPGVPESERARIFEPFHTTSVRGTGLGLAVARRIVELHGGRIEIEDAPEGGAVFRVLIPAAG